MANKTFTLVDTQLNLSISIGASLNLKDDLEEMIYEADEALIEAKTKNKIAIKSFEI